MIDSEIKMLREIIAELNNIKTELSKISEAVNKQSEEMYEYTTDRTVGHCLYCKYGDKPNYSIPCCNCVHGNFNSYKNYFDDITED